MQEAFPFRDVVTLWQMRNGAVILHFSCGFFLWKNWAAATRAKHECDSTRYSTGKQIALNGKNNEHSALYNVTFYISYNWTYHHHFLYHIYQNHHHMVPVVYLRWPKSISCVYWCSMSLRSVPPIAHELHMSWYLTKMGQSGVVTWNHCGPIRHLRQTAIVLIITYNWMGPIYVFIPTWTWFKSHMIWVYLLTNIPLVPHIWVNEWAQHWFR